MLNNVLTANRQPSDLGGQKVKTWCQISAGRRDLSGLKGLPVTVEGNGAPWSARPCPSANLIFLTPLMSPEFVVSALSGVSGPSPRPFRFLPRLVGPFVAAASWGWGSVVACWLSTAACTSRPLPPPSAPPTDTRRPTKVTAVGVVSPSPALLVAAASEAITQRGKAATKKTTGGNSKKAAAALSDWIGQQLVPQEGEKVGVV